MIKAVFFDLDGTLLPFNENEFVKVYFGLLAKKLNPLGYEKDRLVDCLWTGTKKMMMNDGSKTNEEVFWDYFAEVYGQEKLEDKEFINSFYTNEFKHIHDTNSYNILYPLRRFNSDNTSILLFTRNNSVYGMLRSISGDR